MRSVEELDAVLRNAFGLSVAQLRAEEMVAQGRDAFVGGSLVDGFWNRKSDIDIYAFTDEAVEHQLDYDLGPWLPRARRRLVPGLRRVEITYLPERFAEAFGAYFASYLESDAAPMALGPEAMEILHRFATGVPLAGKRSFEGRRARVPPEALRAYLGDVHLRRADSYLEDVVGALEERDLVNATSLACRRLECVADSLLARAGETNTRVEKWRWKKIARAFGTDSDLWRALFELSFTAGGALSADRIRTTLARANALLTDGALRTAEAA